MLDGCRRKRAPGEDRCMKCSLKMYKTQMEAHKKDAESLKRQLSEMRTLIESMVR